MKNAILSSGGVPSVNVTLSGPPEASTFSTVRLEGVSTISNIEYSEEGLRVWEAYKIGPGKLIQWEKQRRNKEIRSWRNLGTEIGSGVCCKGL